MPASILIACDGTISDVSLLTAANPLAVKREWLNCRLVDCVALDKGLDMWISDEGINDGEPVNRVATKLAIRYGLMVQPYFGPALICGVTAHGRSIDLTDHKRQELQQILSTLRAGAVVSR
ncbi:Domain of uncharacterised function (DUF3846) [Mycobacteroides abscessus subsp. abscessus]|uniref:DUF3846 domain-containing protein n=1 Tax=Mycobacteroides abscessus TaxID=36809 RepID=UPI00092860A1|nr:DUF3846 domain-containing protein [Mycobacteroides abscessus]SHU73279.1 Domain of uncharacterised function (DUF3846) [Mycobacteroides abscessus subsp. abscessus]